MNAAYTIPQVDLPALVAGDVSLSRVGRELHGPCPLCGEGTDRFVVWPSSNRFWCRRCEKNGDAVTYVRERDGVGFAQALAILGGMPAMPTLPRIEDRELTPDQRDTFRRVGDICHEQLAGADKPLGWLAARGLNHQSILDWHLGYNPGPLGGTTAVAGCRVQAGITIPLIGVDGLIYGLAVRRPVRDCDKEGAKYINIIGTQVPLYGPPPKHPACLLVEGWADAMLLHRIAGDLVDVAALGTARSDVAARWYPYLLAHRTWLISMDNDDAGEKAAAGWAAWSQRAVLAPVPCGKDATAAWQAVRDDAGWAVADDTLRAWVSARLGECI